MGFLRHISLQLLLLRVCVPPLPEQGFFHSGSFKLIRCNGDTGEEGELYKGFFPVCRMKQGEEMQSGVCTHLCLGDWWVRMLWKSLRSQFNVKICKLAVNRIPAPQTPSLGDLKVRNMWERNSGEKKTLQNVCKWWLILSGVAGYGESSWDLLVCHQFWGHLRALGLTMPFTLRSCEQSTWHTTAELNTDAVLLLLPLEMHH